VLHCSQPAISRRIELLERELGAPLFERVRGGAHLTDAGRAFLPHAEAVLLAVRDGTEAVRAVAQEDRGAVALALVGTLAGTQLTERLRYFRRTYPGIQLTLHTARSREVSALVRRGAAHLGLRYFADPDPDLVITPAGEESLVVVCSAQSPLAGIRAPRVEALAGVPWVSFPVEDAVTLSNHEPYVAVLLRQLRACGLEDAAIVPVDSLTAQKRLIEAEFGVGLLPETAVDEEVRHGALHVLDIPELRATIPIVCVSRRHGYLGQAARRLRDALTD
jgi:DNA-binding transcriptional LysR family regulator